jgi:hypothetical protein
MRPSSSSIGSAEKRLIAEVSIRPFVAPKACGTVVSMTLKRVGSADVDGHWPHVKFRLGSDSYASTGSGKRIHHQTRSTAGNVCDDGAAPMQLGHCAEIDRESQMDLLTLAQSQACGTNEDAGRTEIDGFAEATLSIGQQDVNGRACAMSGM